ncbi:hypothetical protein [Paenibacillus chitinolyticus]|uniref:hypothetical protein n=1 Tax=Paenibacillus chitinolyticus TaxID=79263 RepID=UPI001C47DFA8|nr:hypothetical protein [Paenibacillus chitinolyticus]MBV6716563.1 hypothetical protein [Paenibacillus chitinolyticus]
MAEYFGKLVGKTLFFLMAFFALYMFSFYYGVKLIDLSSINESAHVVRFFVFGTIIASVLSFLGTICLHVIYRYVVKAKNFAPWFRTINLLFLYGSGLLTAIGAMKGFLASNSLVTGHESIFDDRFSIMAMIFFIGLFNYTAYNSIVLTQPREIPIIDWFFELRDQIKESGKKHP